MRLLVIFLFSMFIMEVTAQTSNSLTLANKLSGHLTFKELLANPALSSLEDYEIISFQLSFPVKGNTTIQEQIEGNRIPELFIQMIKEEYPKQIYIEKIQQKDNKVSSELMLIFEMIYN